MLNITHQNREYQLDRGAMAACGSLQHIFEKPLPENPTLIESLSSWNQIKTMKPIGAGQSSFTEIFGELHFNENPAASSASPANISLPASSASSSSLLIDLKNTQPETETPNKKSSPAAVDFYSSPKISHYNNSDSFSSSLQLCTEGLGFESCDDVEDLDFKNELIRDGCCRNKEEKLRGITKHLPSSSKNANSIRRTSRTSEGAFPPPISCIGKTGKPWVCFKSYRHNGRFLLKEIRTPTQEFLHACREDGRLKLQFVQPEDELLQKEDEEDEPEENEDNYDENEENDKQEEHKINKNLVISGGNSSYKMLVGSPSWHAS